MGGLVVVTYVSGILGGPVLAVLAGLLLATFGRGLHLEPPRLVMCVIAMTLLAGAVTVAAARWGSPDLDHIRGAQSVLGPTVLVGSNEVGLGSAAASLGMLLAGAVWLGSLPGIRGFGWIGYALESMLVAAFGLTVFWWPAAHTQSWVTGRTASWLIGGAVGAALAALGVVSHRAPSKFGFGLLAAAAASVGIGVWIVGGAL